MCTGKYIARMDSDDISLPTRFEKQIKFMQRNKNVGILGTWFHIFGNGFDRVEKKPSYPKLSDMIKSSPVGHPTVMMRRSVLDKNNLRYDARYKHAEDYELWARAKKYTKIANLQTVLLEYRWSGNNVSSIYETEQIQTSEVIKQKIRRLLGETKKLTKITNIDDKPVLDELKKLGQFTYMPNSGNMGDALIASATMNWFDRNNVNYMRAVPDTFPENFVYGGGGAWLSRWIKDLAPVMNIMKQAKRVVILPSSFNNVPELVEILDERFIVFCREKSSFDYLVAQKTSAKIILDHDMALRYGDKIKSVPRAHSKRLNKLGKKLKRNLGKIKKCANLFRTDCESAGHYETDLDLSDCMGWFSPYQSRQDIDFAAYTMLNTMYKYDRVCTDRLHVGIAAILAGTDAELYDNTYGKISGVYNQSLDKLSIAHLVKKGD
jgi:exopolysaccharide biosynthesis predicted pyruvyltransferase EpsI